ncbi:hypothetical protein HYH03_010562 [Edaphochlamys debaryana]|uniref:Uncharacterized protein n=1 Tax=Edaphochlamys debaryana TaxID=47281 RepID=A0A835XVR8_9CHLO|nr:hypothetical protein HYH03_010562 [Edaphochlamys debaryana]|eukprot:KAG2491118.1 hypothetical protein HYH03_010562 [Edaphochlamys debaryana]
MAALPCPRSASALAGPGLLSRGPGRSAGLAFLCSALAPRSSSGGLSSSGSSSSSGRAHAPAVRCRATVTPPGARDDSDGRRPPEAAPASAEMAPSTATASATVRNMKTVAEKAELEAALEAERSAKAQLEDQLCATRDSLTQERLRAEQLEKEVLGAKSKAAAMDKALSAVLRETAGRSDPKRAAIVGALLKDSDELREALPESTMLQVLTLAAHELGATIHPSTDQPPAMQLVTLKAVHQALRLSDEPREQVAFVLDALDAKLGGLWSVVRGYQAFFVQEQPGTFMVLSVKGAYFAQLVWIGLAPSMDEGALRGMLDACLLTDEEMAGGPEAWAVISRRPVLRPSPSSPSPSPSSSSSRSAACPSVRCLPSPDPGAAGGGSGGGEADAPDTANPAALKRAWDALLDQLGAERSAKERLRAEKAEKALQKAEDKAQALDTALRAMLAVAEEASVADRVRMVAALLMAVDLDSQALPDTTASKLMALAAQVLGATIRPSTDQPPAMQLTTLNAVLQVLKHPPAGANAAAAVTKVLLAKYGGRWSCVKGWETYSVSPAPNTYMALEMRGSKFIVFRGQP